MDDLMDLFSQISAKQQPLRLINTYKGLTISYDAQIIDNSQGFVTLRVNELQAACIALDSKTYIQNDLLPHIYKAHVVAFDIIKKETVLTEFTIADQSIRKRISNRVQPKVPVEVDICCGEHHITGKIADISSKGLGIFTFAAYIYGELPFTKNSNISIDMKLPGTENVVRLPGKVTNIVKQQGTLLQRLGIRVLTSRQDGSQLSAYVTKRQNEITRELKAIYEAMCQEPQSRFRS